MVDIGTLHLAFSFLAIGTGGWVLWIPKGTRWHRTIGHLYGVAMLGVIVTALPLYEMTGSFGPFHVAAIVGAVTLAGGYWTVLARRPKKEWITAHATWMAWSYVGLMAAFAAESLTRFVMPSVAPLFADNRQVWTFFWISVGVATFAVVGVGSWIIRKRLPGAIASTPEAMRRERARLRDEDPVGPGGAEAITAEG